MPALIAVASVALSGMVPAATTRATAHAMTTPNTSAAELRKAACLLAPD
jgi:hypothetical protein